LNFTNLLINWYLENKRDLPWRATKDPYKIWLSEIILQQTRVAQGTPYYFAFIEAFPTIQNLAAAPEDDVLKLWQGLGYYSRARNLHAAAKYVVQECDGVFPSTYDEIKKLKGVGDYTASAIASICFNEQTAVVDGNVYRVLARVFGIATPQNSTAGIKEFKALAQKLISKKEPATFNQAIMEFGAVQCKPKNPYCLHCPFQKECVAFQTQQIDVLPVKINKTKIKHRYFNYLVLRSEDGKTLLEQRNKKGIWQGLYQFPLVEMDGFDTRFRESVSKLDLLKDLHITKVTQYNETQVVHKLSHQHLHTTFWIVDVKRLPEKSIPLTALKTYAVPVLISNFLDEFIPD